MAVVEALLSDEVRFTEAGETVGFRGRGFLLLVGADGAKEGLEVGVEVIGIDAEVPVEEEEELFLH